MRTVDFAVGIARGRKRVGGRRARGDAYPLKAMRPFCWETSNLEAIVIREGCGIELCDLGYFAGIDSEKRIKCSNQKLKYCRYYFHKRFCYNICARVRFFIWIFLLTIELEAD